MQMLCPDCYAPLETRDGRRARCPTHGGDYQILFARPALPSAGTPFQPPAAVGDPGTPPVPPGMCCAGHPALPAVYRCTGCGTGLCETCAFVVADGRRFCATCAIQGPPAGVGPMATQAIEGPCINHPAVQASYRCRQCGAAVCETCVYKFPGNLMMCPKCATAPQDQISPKRKGYLVWSFVCAFLATLVLAVLLSGVLGQPADEAETQVLGVVVMVGVLGTTIPGLALAAAARIPRQPASAGVWIAWIWNILILVGFLLLCIVGLMMG